MKGKEERVGATPVALEKREELYFLLSEAPWLEHMVMLVYLFAAFSFKTRGLVGTVVGRYGGEEYVAVDVRLADGRCRLFWPHDLEEISPPKAWWRFGLGGEAAG